MSRIPGVVRGWLAAVLVLGALWSAAPPAGAHAVLVSSDPASDALVDAPPSQIVLRFDEGVEGSAEAVRLLDPAGRDVPGVVATVGGTTATATLPELADDGSYTVDWSVVSADGHPIRGAYLFHLRERTLDAPESAVADGTPLAATVLRAGGATLAIAGLVAVFALWFLGRRWRPRWVPVVVGTAMALAGALVAVGEPLSDSWSIVADTTSGRMNVVALLVAVIGLVVSLLPRTGPEELAVAAAAVVGVAVQGHAVSIPPVAWSAGLTAAHVAAAVAWGAALVWVEVQARSEAPDRSAALVRRLSPWGIGAVVVLAASGTALVVDRVGLGQLTGSTYGRLSLLKVGLLVVAVAVAARNRWRLAPRLHDDGSVTALRRSVRAEIVVLALALLAGSVLAQVRPPDTDGAAPAGGAFEQRLAFGDGEVELTVAPGRRGTNEVHVTALGPDGRLMDGVDDLTLQLSLPSAGVGPLEPEMIPITTGHAMSYPEIPLAGTWTVEVSARPSKFEELRADFTVPVGE